MVTFLRSGRGRQKFRWKHPCSSCHLAVSLFSFSWASLNNLTCIFSHPLCLLETRQLKVLMQHWETWALWTVLHFHLVLKLSWVTAYCRSKWLKKSCSCPWATLRHKEWLGGKEPFLTTRGLYLWRCLSEVDILRWSNFLIVTHDSWCL